MTAESTEPTPDPQPAEPEQDAPAVAGQPQAESEAPQEAAPEPASAAPEEPEPVPWGLASMGGADAWRGLLAAAVDAEPGPLKAAIERERRERAALDAVPDTGLVPLPESAMDRYERAHEGRWEDGEPGTGHHLSGLLAALRRRLRPSRQDGADQPREPDVPTLAVPLPLMAAPPAWPQPTAWDPPYRNPQFVPRPELAADPLYAHRGMHRRSTWT